MTTKLIDGLLALPKEKKIRIRLERDMVETVLRERFLLGEKINY